MSIGHYTAVELLKTACPPDSTVLDVGAFPGLLTRQLVTYGWKVIAFDRHPERPLEFRQNCGIPFCEAMAQIGVKTFPVDIEREPLPIASETADAVALTDVIEHLYVDPLFALCEISRVLKPGGTLLLSTPNLLSLRNRVNLALGRIDRVIQQPFDAFLHERKFGHKGHVRLYAPSELGAMLTALGFDPDFRFYSFDFWDAAPGEISPAASTAKPRRSNPFRKLVRSPRSYGRAGIATARLAAERYIPILRPHMFVLAKKIGTANLEELNLIQEIH